MWCLLSQKNEISGLNEEIGAVDKQWFDNSKHCVPLVYFILENICSQLYVVQNMLTTCRV